MGLRVAPHYCGQRYLPELTEIQDEIFDDHVTATKLAQLMNSVGKESAPSTRY